MEIKMQPERFSFQNKNVGEQIEDFKLMEERLTIDEIIEHCKRQTEKLGRYCYKNELGEMKGLDKEYWEHKQVKEYLEELKKYRKLDEQGKMLILPCKPGDTVYICKSVVSFGEIGDKSRVNYRIDKTKFDYWMIPYIGKNVFLTEQEAEKALEGMKNE